MAVSTYAELQQAVSDWLNRGDVEQSVPTFIALCEAELRRNLRHINQETRAHLSIGWQYVDLPNDWLETKQITIPGAAGTHKLDLVSLDDLAALIEEQGGEAGEPRYYAYNAGQIEIAPVPSGTYAGTIQYIAEVPALSDSNTTNWLLTRYPDLYLYGSLKQSAPFLGEDARIATWQSLYQAALDGANLEGKRARYSGTGLRMKVRAY